MPLNDYQKRVSDLARRLGLSGAAESQVYNTPEYAQLVESMFPVNIPPGAKITSQTPGRIEYQDAEGYLHALTRDLNGTSPNLGQISESTNRPAVLPPSEEQQGLLGDITKYARGLTAPVQLAQLDPETQAALAAITANNQAALKQQFDRESANQLASLFGNRINESSIATNALGDLLQKQGLVSSQSMADAAQRELQTRQFLTQAGAQRSSDLLDLLKNLSGQQTQRDISAGGIEQSQRGLDLEKMLGLKRLDLDRYLGQLQAGAARSQANRGLIGSGIGAAATIIGAL